MGRLKGAKTVTAVFLGCLLAGCSTLSLTYNFADWIMLWRIDHYFDLSSDQRQILEERLTNLHAWHRTQELPLYADFLRQIQQNLHNGFTREGIDALFQSYFQLRADLGRRIASEGTLFLTTVNSEQVQFLQNVMEEENEELLQEVDGDLNERLATRTGAILDWLENWLGNLTEPQKHHIVRLIQKLPDTSDSWMHYRTHRQKQFIALLQAEKSPMVLEQKIGDWFANPEKGAPDDYPQAVSRMRTALKSFVLEIEQIMTLEQREYGIQKLQHLIEEVESLAST
ncbi:MAG: hypothetical protein IH977_06135 [Nitrospinae bacterium]|nr:hypothetical protein [Nitrospinota bacterium]